MDKDILSRYEKLSSKGKEFVNVAIQAVENTQDNLAKTQEQKWYDEARNYEEVISDSIYDLEKAQMALQDLLDTYHWDYEPTAQEAMVYFSTVGAGVKCSEEEKRSWQYIADYKKIMWLVSVARDYCQSALESCSNAYYREVCHE